MALTLPPNLLTPHVEVTRGPAGWNTTVRGSGGIILAYGFCRPRVAYLLPDEIEAKAWSTRYAMEQLR